MTTHTTPDVRREDAIGTPPRRPVRVPADPYYTAAFAQLEAQPGLVLTHLDLPAEDRIAGGEPGGGGS